MKKSSSKSRSSKKSSVRKSSRATIPEVIELPPSVPERTALALERVTEASERTAMALERIAGAMEVTSAPSEVAPTDPTQMKLSSRKGLPCPFCETADAIVIQRGATVFGCMECIGPLFEDTLARKLNEKSWVAGAEWAEAIMRLGRTDATREEIAEEIKKEIERRKENTPP